MSDPILNQIAALEMALANVRRLVQTTPNVSRPKLRAVYDNVRQEAASLELTMGQRLIRPQRGDDDVVLD